jgi:glycosyltransferase involved in cell wall biosynthesis
MIDVNTRTLSAQLTGVQRYLKEILDKHPDAFRRIEPRQPLRALKGHGWEQTVLPLRSSGLLWSPGNTGPLVKAHQIVTLHDVVPFDMPHTLDPKFAAVYQFLTPRLVRRVEKVITISNFSKSAILRHMPVDPDKIVIIPNGVDERFHPKPPAEVAQAIAQAGIPFKRYVLTLGSIEPRKNLATLFKAWRQVEDAIDDDIGLVVVGKTGASNIFKSIDIDDRMKRVHFTGHLPDGALPAIYSGATAFVCISLYEGFGLPPLEALACGAPTLASNTTALPEVVGDAAWTVDPTDVGAVTDALIELVRSESEQQRLRAKGLVQARQFPWADTARQTLALLSQHA